MFLLKFISIDLIPVLDESSDLTQLILRPVYNNYENRHVLSQGCESSLAAVSMSFGSTFSMSSMNSESPLRIPYAFPIDESLV